MVSVLNESLFRKRHYSFKTVTVKMLNVHDHIWLSNSQCKLLLPVCLLLPPQYTVGFSSMFTKLV